MSGSLTGIKVLDFTQMMAGPLCSMTLGDMGATVIKVEPETGDTMRETGQSRYLGESEYFLGLNRNNVEVRIVARRAGVQCARVVC